jgi:hypothetical protein
MRTTFAKPLGAGLLALAMVGGLAGCYTYAPAPRPAPPPHARVWYPYDYYYYPRAQVYFQISTGYYWYHHHHRWYRTHRLPRHIVILRRDRVHIRVHRGEPWRYNHDHTRRYHSRVPSGEWHDRHGSRDYRDRDRVEREHNTRQYRDYRERKGRGSSGGAGRGGDRGDRRPAR